MNPEFVHYILSAPWVIGGLFLLLWPYSRCVKCRRFKLIKELEWIGESHADYGFCKRACTTNKPLTKTFLYAVTELREVNEKRRKREYFKRKS